MRLHEESFTEFVGQSIFSQSAEAVEATFFQSGGRSEGRHSQHLCRDNVALRLMTGKRQSTSSTRTNVRQQFSVQVSVEGNEQHSQQPVCLPLLLTSRDEQRTAKFAREDEKCVTSTAPRWRTARAKKNERSGRKQSCIVFGTIA